MRAYAAALLMTLLLAGCAAPPPEPDPVRQALHNLSERAAGRVMDVAELQPPGDQVLLLPPPEVDSELEIDSERFLESLTRALLGATPGPQVLDLHEGMSGDSSPHQWRLVSRLASTGPRLQLSDRDLLPYRLTLTLQRPDADAAIWQTEIEGAFDASAL